MTSARSAALVLLLSALLAVPSASAFARPGDLRPAIVSENAELASRITAEQVSLGQERAALARLRAQHDDLEARLQRVARQAALGATGREFAVMVRSEPGALPRPELIAAEARQREQTREAASDVRVRAENQALALADLDRAIEGRLAGAAAAPDREPRVPDEAAVR